MKNFTRKIPDKNRKKALNRWLGWLTFSMMLLMGQMSFAQFTFPSTPGPINVPGGTTGVTLDLNDTSNLAGVTTNLYESFTVTVDWENGYNAFSSETRIRITTSGGNSLELTSPQAASNGNAVTLTFSGDLNGIYDPSSDASLSIRLRQTWSSSDADWSNLSVTLNPVPTCPAPTALTASNPTLTSIDLSWDGTGGASGNYEIKWGAPGFDIDAATAIPVAGLTHTLVGTGGSYQFVVREICAVDDESAWSGRYAFNIPNLGDDCSAPIVVGALPYTTTDDTANYTDNPNIEGSPGASGCGTTSSYLNGNDVVYAYTAAFDGVIQVKMTPSGTWSGIFAYADCADIGTACIGGASNTGSAVNMFELNVADGDTYYFVISTWASPQTVAYTLDISQVLCPKPTGVAHTDVTHNSTNVSWDVLGDYEINWGTGTFVAGDGTNTDTVTAATEFLFTGLNGSTAYRYFVRQNCGGTDGDSEWVGPFTFTTLVAPASIPWMEGFITTTIPTGWTQTGFSFGVATAITNAPGGVEGNVIYKNLWSSATSGNFQTIRIGTVSSGDILSFIHKTHNYGDPYAPPAVNSGNFIVAISTDNGANYTNIQTITNDGVSEGWQNFEYDLSGYDGEYVRIRISATRTAGDYYLAFDNFYVGQPITCEAPTALTALNITTNTADLSWTSEGSTFDISWGAGAFDAEDGTIVSLANGGTLSGLAPQTAYQYYVRQNCGIGDASMWAGPFGFTTDCTSFPLLDENFDSYATGSIVPDCWVRLVPATSVGSQTITSTTPASGTRNIYQYATASQNPVIVVLPSFSNVNDGTHWLKFKAKVSSGAPGALQVGYVTDATDYDSFVLIETLAITNTSYTADAEYTVEIPTSVPAGAKLAVKNAADGKSYYWDDVVWEEAPSCIEPSALTATPTSLTEATLSWTSGGSLFDIEWGEEGFMQGSGTMINGVSTNSQVLSGLITDTSYSYYVRQDCGTTNGQSLWSGPYTFYIGYCIPAGTSTTNYITGFTTSGGTVNISNTDNGLSAGGYGDFFLFHNLTQEIGDSVDFEVTTFGTVTSGLKIWVDWNQNGSFEDDGELVYATNAYANIHTGSFTVSNDALAGQTRMRIGNSNTPNTGPASPCMTNLAGEYEDYMLTVYIPDCAKPFDLALDAVTINSATISWTSTGSLFDIELGEEGFFQSGVPTTSGVTNPHTINGLDPSTTYEFYVRQDCGTDGYSNWAGPFRFTTECLPPNITGTTPGEVCGEGEVTLSATADGGTIAWYANETGGPKLNEGASFTTPELTTTTSYWVSAFLGGGMENVGPENPSIGAGGYSTLNTYVTFFTVTSATSIASVDVFVNSTSMGSSGAIKITDMSDNSTVGTYPYIVTQAGSLTEGQTILIDQALSAGNYKMEMVGTTVSLYRNTAGAAFPYTSSTVNLTGQSFDGYPEYYYFFYNWVIGSECSSARTEVIATVTDAPDFELSQTTLEICEGDTSDAVTITTGASDYDTFEWTPSLGVSGDATTGWSFDPTESTTYVLTASQSAGAGCVTTFEVQVNVNPLPTAITVVASETEVCDDTIVALSVTGNINNGIAILGNGTTAPGATAWPNPLSTWFGGTKHQMLYTAAELSAQGMMAGSEISAVTFDIEAVHATNGACVDFTIRMGATTVNEMTEIVSGTTTVYGPNTFTPHTIGVGLASFTLTTPYVWDGVSNLVVETVHNSGNSGNGSGTRTKATSTPNNSVFRVAKDNVAGGIPGFDTTTFTATGAHNQRPNMTFTYTLEQTAITWSPATNLYTDAAATTAYVADDFATAVYFKADALGTVTYTATSHTDEGCSISDSVEITANETPDAPVATSPQLMDEGQTIADIIVTGDNLTWYTDEDLTDEVDASTVLTEGTYTFYVTASVGDCTSEATMITVEVSLSTKDFDTATFKAYPNPVKDYFNISYSKDIQNIAVINMLGQTIFTKTVHATDTQIDMTSLPTGTYFVKVNVDGAVKTIKVAKQ